MSWSAFNAVNMWVYADAQAAPAAAPSRERLQPGTDAALARLAEVKLTPDSQLLEKLLLIPVRMALRVDRSAPRLPQNQTGPRSLEQAPQSPKIWARAMHVLKRLLAVLPTTPLHIYSVTMKAQKEMMSQGELGHFFAAQIPRFRIMFDAVLASALHG